MVENFHGAKGLPIWTRGQSETVCGKPHSMWRYAIASTRGRALALILLPCTHLEKFVDLYLLP